MARAELVGTEALPQDSAAAAAAGTVAVRMVHQQRLLRAPLAATASGVVQAEQAARLAATVRAAAAAAAERAPAQARPEQAALALQVPNGLELDQVVVVVVVVATQKRAAELAGMAVVHQLIQELVAEEADLLQVPPVRMVAAQAVLSS